MLVVVSLLALSPSSKATHIVLSLLLKTLIPFLWLLEQAILALVFLLSYAPHPLTLLQQHACLSDDVRANAALFQALLEAGEYRVFGLDLSVP